MRVLVLCDDHWHPAHIPRSGLAPLESDSLAFDWIEDATDWSAATLAEYPVVILTKANNRSSADETPWATEDMQRAFVAYVRGGGRLLVIHSGMAGYGDPPLLRELVGGAFVSHPPQCPVTVEPHTNHPLAAHSAPFTLVDEHYFMALDDQEADVFLTTSSQHGQQPGGWTRSVGLGRVCVLTPGHNLEIWLHPAFQTLLKNALAWCNQ